MKTVYVIIPNYNGADKLEAAVESIRAQSFKDWQLLIVDNGSTDGSHDILTRYQQTDERIRTIYRDKNYGYTGGVNPGFRLAIDEGAAYAAPFNNDAIADKHWLRHLVDFLDAHPKYGIATCKLLHLGGKTIDSTGDIYTVWGLPYPRGRDEPAGTQYDHQTDIFGASGGASLYRVEMLRRIGVFDQDFFAYYEDIDLSFRAQLAGWKVSFVPSSVVYHEQGGTSSRMKNGFTTCQYMRNLPMVLVKDVPGRLFWRVAPRLALAYSIFFVKAVVAHRTGWWALKGLLQGLWLLPKNILKRRRIQKQRTVTSAYIWSLFLHDLPPNAQKLKRVRAAWWRLTGRRVTP